MKILIDIGHPAHVHFFKNPIRLLQERGHDIIITSRVKEFAVDLLDQFSLSHYTLSALGSGGLLGLGTELITRNYKLYKIIKQHKPDVMAAIGGVSIAQVGKLTGVPSLVFYDTENAKLQNAITYPFATKVIVPQCYEAWLPRKSHIRYAGYHELSYLHPDYFSPDKNIAIKNGLSEHSDTFFLRMVSWKANHDIGETGWSYDLLLKLIDKLAKKGKIIISSESKLDSKLEKYSYTGSISDVHHILAYCRCFIGESATMASEAAVLGVPAIYAAKTGRGYTNEQESKYSLVKNIHELSWDSLESLVNEMLSKPSSYWLHARQQLLNDTIDVAKFVADCIEHHQFAVPFVQPI